jgi:hypothetical protein
MFNDVKAVAGGALRWIAIAVAGGYGVWQLICAGRGVMQWNGDWFSLAFVLVFPLAIATPCLAVAYLCLRRLYRKLFLVVGVIGCMVVFAGLSALPGQLGIFQFMERHERENRDLAIVFLPLGLLMLFGPIYAAAWFYRLCQGLAYPEMKKRPKTRATRGLVWLGVVCLAVAPIIVMVVTLSDAVQSPTVPVSPESLEYRFRWIIGLTVLGALVIFLGLVHRQPITELGAEGGE